MATIIPPRRFARILCLQEKCAAVDQTDRKKRLPRISSAEVDTIFDQMSRETLRLDDAA